MDLIEIVLCALSRDPVCSFLQGCVLLVLCISVCVYTNVLFVLCCRDANRWPVKQHILFLCACVFVCSLSRGSPAAVLLIGVWGLGLVTMVTAIYFDHPTPCPLPHTRTSYLILFSLWLSPFCRSTYFLLSPLHLFCPWLLLPYLYRTKWELNSSNECQSFVFFLQCREAAISKPLKYNIKCVDKLFQNLGRASVELTLNKF